MVRRIAWRLAVVVLACVVAIARTQSTTAAPPPPPRPTYPRDVAVLPTPQTYSQAVAAARRWRNSSLLVVRSVADNDAARAALSDEGAQRGWLGAYRDVNAGAFYWIDGVRVGDPSRPFTNWAPDRPVTDTVGTAIAVDMASGLWFDLAQGTLNAAVVDTPAREVTETEPLPGFEFPPGVPPKPIVPPWQTAVIVACSLLTIILLGATIGLWVWHFDRPIRVDNRSGFVVEPPPDKAPVASDAAAPPAVPLKHDQTHIAEPLRYNDPETVAATTAALGKPLDLGPPPDGAPPPPPAADGAPPAQAQAQDGAQKSSGGSRRQSAVHSAANSRRPSVVESAAQRSRRASIAEGDEKPPSEGGGPPGDEDEDDPPPSDGDDPQDEEEADVADRTPEPEAAPAPPPPRPLPKAKALPKAQSAPGPAAGMPARKLPPPAAAAPAARKLPQATPVGGAKRPPGPPGPSPVSRKLPPSTPAAAGNMPGRKLPPSAPVGGKSKAAAPVGRKLPPSRPV